MDYLRIVWNIVDVLVVSYIVYRLIALIQGTKAMQVVWGLIFLLILTFSAKLLKLKATMWLLQQFWIAGIVILIVVFQPEIRSALADLGKKPLGRILASSEFNFIHELIEAVRLLASRKVGFIAVLEQDIGLRDIVEKGVSINGEVSKELLISIFNTKAPLHDGAVIISNNRLVAAACPLPLTDEPNLSKVFGMRHRAALGVTEISDAVVLVVSEETGKVSLVRSGRIQTDIDIDEVERRLVDLYRSRAEKSLLRKAPRV
jgi:diadenylate cyclase